MPTTAILNLRTLNSGKIPRSFHSLMHPVFLAKIADRDPVLGTRLHDRQLMSAFSISPVMNVRGERIETNQRLWVRISLLTDEMEACFIDSLEKGEWAATLHLGQFPMAVESIALGPQTGRPWGGRMSFDALKNNSRPMERVAFKIQSPMAFKRGDLHYPLPDPALVFGNLLRRWNSIAPFTLSDLPSMDGVSYSFLDIKTKPYALRKGGTIFGCQGRLVFIFKTDPVYQSYFNLLLNFAFFSGLGVKTSQGMGMCRIVDDSGYGRGAK